jgi:hypothetical protein
MAHVAQLDDKPKRREHRKSFGKIFSDGTPPTTENILVKLMLARENARPSALQRAVCRAMDGISLVLSVASECMTIDRQIVCYPAGFDLWELEEVRIAFGNERPPEKSPAMFCHFSAVRCAKSMTAAAKALQMIAASDFSDLAPGDIPMLPILAPDMKAARQTWQHICGTLEQSERLRKLLAKKPRGESIWVYHPSGRAVEITVRALSRFGTALTSRWCVGVIWDEAPRMVGAQDGAKNIDESVRAARGRVLPGGQLMLIGSPSHPYGPVYDLYTKHFGRPDEDIVICKARGDHLNPKKWTLRDQEAFKRQDPNGHRTDFLAEFGDPEEAFFSSDSIERNRRRDPEVLPFDAECSYVAAMDPAGRANAWTLIILARKPSPDLRERYAVALAKQWRLPRHRTKGDFLQPTKILSEIKELINSYGINEVHTDQYAVEVLMALGETMSLDVLPHDLVAENRREAANAIRVCLEEDRIELAPDHYLREDLVRVEKRITGGVNTGVGIHLPKSSDGRHCDYFPSLGLCMLHPPSPPGYSTNRSVSEEDRIIAQLVAQNKRSSEANQTARALWS